MVNVNYYPMATLKSKKSLKIKMTEYPICLKRDGAF